MNIIFVEPFFPQNQRRFVAALAGGGRHRKLVATFGPKLAAYTEAINRALNNPDPWRGFCHYLITITAMQRGDRGFRDILTQALPRRPRAPGAARSGLPRCRGADRQSQGHRAAASRLRARGHPAGLDG